MSLKQIRYIAKILLLLYVGYYGCVSYFVHTHIYNGVVYVHSHPYDKHEKTSGENDLPPFETHAHNAAGFFSINQASNIVALGAATDNLIADVDIPIYTFLYKIKKERKTEKICISTCLLRAPPTI